MQAVWILVTLAGAAAMAVGYGSWAADVLPVLWGAWVLGGLVVACTGAYFVGGAVRAE